MSPSSVTCPGCKASLRTASPLPPGKSIKCPRCNVIFVVPGRAAPTQQMQAAARMPAPSPRTSPSAAGTMRRPAVSAAGPGPDFRRKKGNGLLVATLCIAGAVVLLGSGGAVAWFLMSQDSQGPRAAAKPSAAAVESPATEPAPTSTSTRPADSGRVVTVPTFRLPDPVQPPVEPPSSVDPLAFLPPDSNMIMGANLGSIMEIPEVAAAMQPLLKQSRVDIELFKTIGLPFKEFADQVILGFKFDPDQMNEPGTLPEEITLVIHSKLPFDGERVQKALGSVVKFRGKEYVRNKEDDNPVKFAFVPSNRILVMSSLPLEKLHLLRVGASKPSVPEETVRLVRQVDKSQVWLTMALSRRMRKEMEVGLAPAAENLPPEYKPMLDSLKKAEALAIWGGLQDNKLRLNLGIGCSDAAGAVALHEGAAKLWETIGKPLALQDAAKERLKTLPPYLQDITNDFLDSLKFTHQETLASVSIELRFQPLATLVKEVEDKGPQAFAAALAQQQAVKPPAPPQPAGDFAEAEKDLLILMNEARDREKVPMLKSDPKLVKAALVHSQNMAKQMKLTHELDGKNFDKRTTEAGYNFRLVNEYVLKGNVKVAGKQVYEAMINNDQGRKLMLDKAYEETGIAFARNDKNEIYITIVVASPQK